MRAKTCENLIDWIHISFDQKLKKRNHRISSMVYGTIAGRGETDSKGGPDVQSGGLFGTVVAANA